MDWTEVSIITKSEAVEAVSNFIQELGSFVSIQDPKDLFNTEHKYVNDMIIDEEIFKSEHVVIKAYFSQDTNIKDKVNKISEYVKNISNFVDVGSGQVITARIQEEDWENGWKKYYKPTKIGKKIVIKPIWEMYNPKSNEVIVQLDPGMAFGTGTHETTRMCVKFLEKYVDRNSKVLDVGCGSGILSICASKLGAIKVTGVDIDPVAVKASKENILINKIDNIQIIEGNLFEVVNEKFNVVVANIIADIIINMTEAVKNYLSMNGRFICSGIIEERYDDVKKSLMSNGFEIIDEMRDKDWVAIVSRIK